MQNTVIVKNNQSVLDLGIQIAGALDAVFDLAIENDVSITDVLMVLSEFAPIKPQNREVVEYYINNNISPATGFVGSPLVDLQGIGYWAIGIDFIVSE